MSTQAHSLLATLYATWQEYQIPAIYYHYLLTILQKQTKPNQVVLMSREIQRLKNNTHPYHNIIDQIQARERALKQVIQNVHVLDQAIHGHNYQAQFQSALPPDYSVEPQYHVLHSQHLQIRRRHSLQDSPTDKNKSITHFINHLRIYQRVTVQVITLIDKWQRQVLSMGYKSDGVIQFLYHKQDYLEKINADTIGILKQYEHIFQRNPFLLIKKSHQESELALVYQSAKCNSDLAKKMEESLNILSDHEASLLKNRLLGAFSQKGKIKLTKASSLKKLYMNYKPGSDYYEIKLPFKYPKMNSPDKKNALLTTEATNNQSYLLVNSDKAKNSINYGQKRHPVYFYDNPENNPHRIIKESYLQNSRQISNANKYKQQMFNRGMLESDQQLLPITLKRSGSSLVSDTYGKSKLMINSREVQSDLDKKYGGAFNIQTKADNGRPFDKKLKMLEKLHNNLEYLPNKYMLKSQRRKNQLLFNDQVEAQQKVIEIERSNQQTIREVRSIKIDKDYLQKSRQSQTHPSKARKNSNKQYMSNQKSKELKFLQERYKPDNQIDVGQVQNDYEQFQFNYESNIDQLNVVAYVRDHIFLNQTNPYSRNKDGQSNRFKQEIDLISKKILQHRGQIVCIRIVAKGTSSQRSQLLVGFAAVVLLEKGQRLKRTADIIVFKKFLLVEKLQTKLINSLVSKGYGIILRQNQMIHNVDLSQPISLPLVTVRYKMALHHLTKDQLKRSIKKVDSLKHSRLLKYYYYSKNSVYHDYCTHKNSSCQLTFPVQQLKKILIDGKAFYKGTIDKIQKTRSCYRVQMHLSSVDLFIGKSIGALCELAESSFGFDQSQNGQQESQKQENNRKKIENPKQYHFLCLESSKLIHKYLDHNQNLLLSEFLTTGDQAGTPNSISFRSNSLILRDSLIIRRPYYLAFVCKKQNQKGKALAIMNFE